MFKTGLLRRSGLVKNNGLKISSGGFIGNKWKLNNQSLRLNSTKAVETASEIKSHLKPFDSVPGTDSMLTSDTLGYLDSIGMASGFGPTALVERLLEYTHVYSGLPWWGTIIIATVAVRSAMFPLYIKSSINAAKMAKVKPELDAVMTELKEAESPQEQLKASHKRKAIMKSNDIHMSHQMLPILQLPVAYGFFQALRKMANHPVEGFSTQGYGWFSDLTQVDPYLGLQVITAAFVIGMVRMGGETGANPVNPMIKKVMTWVPILSIFITKELSTAVLVYFAANSIFSFLQSIVLRNKTFRRIANMPPIIPASQLPNAAKQPTTIREWWNDLNKSLNKNVENKMKESNTKLGVMQKRKRNNSNGFIKKH